MAMLSQKNLEKLRRAQKRRYGVDNTTFEFSAPEFALFFNNPDYAASTQVLRKFSFDNNYEWIFDYTEASERDADIVSSMNYRRVFEFKLNSFVRKEIKGQIEKFVTTDDINSKVKWRKKSKNIKFGYFAPWVGIPFDPNSLMDPDPDDDGYYNTSPVDIQLPVTNLWRRHSQPKSEDTHWRSKLPEKNNVELELFVDKLDGEQINVKWIETGTAILNCNFLDDPEFANNHFEKLINIEYSGLVRDPNVLRERLNGKVLVKAEHVPRHIYLTRKIKSGKREVIGSFSLLPMPYIKHHLLFFNATRTSVNSEVSNYTLTQLGPQRAGRSIPNSLDVSSIAGKTATQIKTQQQTLGTITQAALKNQYGVDVQVSENIIFRYVTYRSDTAARLPENANQIIRADDGTIASFEKANSILLDPNNADAEKKIISYNLQTPQSSAVAIENQMFEELSSGFLGQLTRGKKIGRLEDADGPILDDDNNEIDVMQRMELIDETGNIYQSTYSNLSVIFLCDGLPIPPTPPVPNPVPPGYVPPRPSLTLGLGSTPPTIFPTSNSDDITRNSLYLQRSRDSGYAFSAQYSTPGVVCLFDNAKYLAPGLDPVPGDTNTVDGTVTWYSERTLTHEILHNLGLPHIFKRTGPDDTVNDVDVSPLFQKRFNRDVKYEASTTSTWAANYDLDTSLPHQVNFKTKLKKASLARNSYTIGLNNLWLILNDFGITQMEDEQYLNIEFNIFDILSYYGYGKLLVLLNHSAVNDRRGLILRGLRNVDAKSGFFQPLTSPSQLTIGVNQQNLNTGFVFPYSSITIPDPNNPVRRIRQLGHNPWLKIISDFSKLHSRNDSATSINIYETTYPQSPLNREDQIALNYMDYGFFTNKTSKSNTVSNNQAVVSDRGYLMKHQWDTLRFTLNWLNTFEP